MGFIDVIKERARNNKKTIVLPETEDRRTYEATAQILKEGIANVVLVGSEEAVKKIFDIYKGNWPIKAVPLSPT